jgi:hypothetical protein
MSKQTHKKFQKFDKKEVLQSVMKDGNTIYYFDSVHKDDPEIGIAAVRQDGESLRFLGKNLQNNKEIVLEAIKQNPFLVLPWKL